MKNLLIVVTGVSAISGILGSSITGCADLNIEVQQTSRVHSAASRNPYVSDSDIQGSERSQGKNPIGIKATSDIANKNATTTLKDSDVTGAEK